MSNRNEDEERNGQYISDERYKPVITSLEDLGKKKVANEDVDIEKVEVALDDSDSYEGDYPVDEVVTALATEHIRLEETEEQRAIREYNETMYRQFALAVRTPFVCEPTFPEEMKRVLKERQQSPLYHFPNEIAEREYLKSFGVPRTMITDWLIGDYSEQDLFDALEHDEPVERDTSDNSPIKSSDGNSVFGDAVAERQYLQTLGLQDAVIDAVLLNKYGAEALEATQENTLDDNVTKSKKVKKPKKKAPVAPTPNETELEEDWLENDNDNEERENEEEFEDEEEEEDETRNVKQLAYIFIVLVLLVAVAVIIYRILVHGTIMNSSKMPNFSITDIDMLLDLLV